MKTAGAKTFPFQLEANTFSFSTGNLIALSVDFLWNPLVNPIPSHPNTFSAEDLISLSGDLLCGTLALVKSFIVKLLAFGFLC